MTISLHKDCETLPIGALVTISLDEMMQTVTFSIDSSERYTRRTLNQMSYIIKFQCFHFILLILHIKKGRMFQRFYDVIALRSHCSAHMHSFVVCNTRLIDYIHRLLFDPP